MQNPIEAAALPEPVPTPSEATTVVDPLPPLLSDVGFWGMNATQFLGAFNDNLFKQLLLLLATPAAAQVGGSDRQGEAMMIFATAFLIFSGFAGWLADRFSKRNLILLCKLAEIAIMGLGLIGFFYWDAVGLTGMFAVLFLMGTHSAFFGPPKYGILPEMLDDRNLPQANGIFLMFTFLAIIFGTALIAVFGATPETAWRGGAFCLSIAVLGTLTSLLVPRVKPVNQHAKLRLVDLFISPEMIRLVMRDKQLLYALIVTSSFWMLGGMVTSGVNALGKTQLDVGDMTSVLTAMLGVGIPVGCVVGGYISRERLNPRQVIFGATGIVFCLLLLAMPFGPRQHLLGFYGSIPVLALLGFCAGVFVVPIQVALQVRPPAEEKGRMIALMNQANWIGIILGALFFKVVIQWLEGRAEPRCLVFLATAAIIAPVAMFYRPHPMTLRKG